MKKITLLFFISFTLFAVPTLFAQEKAGQEEATPKDEQPQIIISVIDNDVRIQHAPLDSVVEIYNILGVKIISERIDSSDKTINLNIAKGYYILKIENTVRKIVIR